MECDAGHLAWPDGTCKPVGIQGCAALFIEDDHLCHPSIDKCPVGTIPKFDQGCVPVGIPMCAAEFLESDGQCHPAMAKCPAGTFAVPQDGCVPIDGTIGYGSGTCGDIPDEPLNVYVDLNYAGGDGSMQKPFPTIAQAMNAVASGGRIALAAGTYAEGVSFNKPNVTLEGRCPSMVRIEGTVPTNLPSYSPAAMYSNTLSGTTIRRLTVAGNGIGVYIWKGADVIVDQVHAEKTAIAGVAAFGATVTVSNTLVENTTPDGQGKTGRGVRSDSAALTVERSAIVNNGIGMLVVGESLFTANGNLVESTEPLGAGIDIRDTTTAELSRNAIVGSEYYGITHLGADAPFSENVLERNAKPGLLANNAKFTMQSCAVLSNGGHGVHLTGGSTDGTIEGSLIRGSKAIPNSNFCGVIADDGANLVLSNDAIVENEHGGVVAWKPGTTMTMTKTLAEGTILLPNYPSSSGIEWPEYGQHRTSSDKAKFSGVQFRFEAIYQKTVTEMEAMGSVFWLVFVPLAIDVDQDKLIRVIDTLKRSTSMEDYGDLVATMLEIAYMKKDRPELAKVIRSHGKRDAITFGSVWQEAKREGKREGKLELLLRLFERRLGRPLTAGEQRSVASRLNKRGAVAVGNVVCELAPEQLGAWLAPNGHRSS